MEADAYGESPEMSTYLVAFVVSQFKSTSDVTSRGLKVWNCCFPISLYRIDNFQCKTEKVTRDVRSA